jgi:hypothetical protein
MTARYTPGLRIVNFLACLLAAALCLASCQKDEQGDAERLAKALAAVQPNADAAVRMETELLNRARPWCDSMSAAGAGHDTDLDRNTAIAAELAQAAQGAAERWATVRKALRAQRLRGGYAFAIRAGLADRLSSHEQALEKLRGALRETETQFRALAQNRSNIGATVPAAVRTLDTVLGGYEPPRDEIAAAVQGLREKSGARP